MVRSKRRLQMLVKGSNQIPSRAAASVPLAAQAITAIKDWVARLDRNGLTSDAGQVICSLGIVGSLN